MPLAFVLTTGVAFILLSITERVYIGTRIFLGWPTVAVICLVTVPAFTGLFFMIGEYNLSPLQGVVEMNKYGCCTEGMVFLQHQVPGLIQWLEERKSGQPDLLIEEYADAKGLRRFAYAPPQLRHIGTTSSRFNFDINTRSTWAFFF
jgi:hypothetical protein